MTPEPLDPGFQSFVDAIAAAQANGAPEWHTLSPEQIRAATANIRKGAAPVMGVTRRDLLIEGREATLPARLYVPDGAAAIGPGLT